MTDTRNVHNPLTCSQNYTEIERFSSRRIIEIYQKALDIDISKYFTNIDSISLYKSKDTGLEFFWPLELSGDEKLYQVLQSFDWYYMEDKWEYDIVMKYLGPKKKILELGCGNGSFLKKIRDKSKKAVGLELNSDTVTRLKRQGFEVYNNSIEDHSLSHQNYYDLVVSFQVMEHVPNPDKILRASISALSEGGRLIISVPNNNSFIKFQKYNYLNIPPHHVLRWNEQALRSLESLYPITLEKIVCEPLQSYHVDWYSSLWLRRNIHNERIKTLVKLTKADLLFKKIIRSLSFAITGHSIIAVFYK